MPYINEANLILKRARSAGLDASVYGRHLVSKVTVCDYIRMANDIKKILSKGILLDWGCGYGQMSFLLQRRGFTVRSYDVANRVYSEASSVFQEVIIAHGDDPVALPYSDGTFDAVLSCGVLEHVPQETGSLAEIRRVLRPGGYLFVTNLPQRGSYKEFLLALLRAGYTHDRKYSLASAVRLLEQAGFRVEHTQRAGFLPHNLTPLPVLRGIYNFLAQPVLALDSMLCKIPWLNRTAEALEIVAVKK